MKKILLWIIGFLNIAFGLLLFIGSYLLSFNYVANIAGGLCFICAGLICIPLESLKYRTSVIFKFFTRYRELFAFLRLVILGLFFFIAVLALDPDVQTDQTEFNTYQYLSSLPISESTVMNGSGTESIGTRAYISLSGVSFEDLDLADLRRYANENITGHDYNWFTIFITKDTGLVFIGGDVDNVDYSKVDLEGMVNGSIGYLMPDGDTYTYQPYTDSE